MTRATRRQLYPILLLGIVTRIIVFFVQGPFNNDRHFEIIQFVSSQQQIPVADAFNQAYHPPLYYLLAAPFLQLGGPKAVQLLSLLFSLATLSVIFYLISTLQLFGSIRVRRFCLLLAALMPQLILHGNFVSNDPLTILLATLLCLQIYRCLQRPSFWQQQLLALVAGLGLLTKATFLGYIPVLLVFVVLLNFWQPQAKNSRFVNVLLFLTIMLGVGCFKYVQNYLTVGAIFYNNLDLGEAWVAAQQGVARGPGSWLDLNLLKLLENPTVSTSTAHSYPLMLYGSFWYQYVIESNFRGGVSGLKYLGSLLYLTALLPTFLMTAGSIRIGSFLRDVPSLLDGAAAEKRERLYALLLVALFICNLALVLITGVKYDVWSIFQGRLLFPSIFPVLVMFAYGLNLVESRNRVIALGGRIWLYVFFAACISYWVFELPRALQHPIDPNTNYHMPYEVSM